MDDRNAMFPQELEHLMQKNKILSEENSKLNKSVEFLQAYIETEAKLRAIEYIVRTEEYSIRREGLAQILGIQLLPKED